MLEKRQSRVTLTNFAEDSLNRFIGKLSGGCCVDDIEDIYPCTAMQESILISQRYNNHEYFVSVVVQIETLASETVDFSRLQNAWTSMVQKSAILRTCFVEESTSGGLFSQVVLKRVGTAIKSIKCVSVDELNNLPCAWTKDSIAPHCMRYCEIPGQGSFLRLEVNHANSDGVSLFSLMTQLMAFYDNPESEIAGISYREFVEHVQSLSQPDDLAFWKTRLANAEPSVFPQLKTDTEGTLQGQDDIGRKRACLDRNKIRTVMVENSTSLTMFFQAVWAVLLQAYIGRDDVLFGYASSGRRIACLPGIEQSQGPFISQMVARATVDPTETWPELAGGLSSRSKEDLQHEHCSLSDIQKTLSVDSLFNTVMDVQRLPPLPKVGREIYLHFVDSFTPTQHRLVANVEDRGGVLLAKFSYSKTWFTERDIDLIIDTFTQIVDQFVNYPHYKIEELDLVSASQKGLMTEWNKTVPASVDTCVHHLFEKHVTLQPDAPAVCSTTADDNFSYAELDDLAERLAYHLSSLGVGAETLVPFCFDKSPWAIVTMLAILKAGGACVALDPSHPAERLKNILAETNAGLVVCESIHASKFIDLVHVVSIQPSLWDSLEIGQVRCPATLSSPSFVTFTSGSTGVPKGIVLTHNSLATSIRNHGRLELMTPNCRTLQFGSYTFDVSVEEVFTTLSFGGCVCVPNENERLNNLEATMEKLKVNWAHLTPTVAGLLDPFQTPSLKTLVLGGEAIPENILSKWLGRVKVIASYGPAECSITCSGVEVIRPTGGLMGQPSGALLWIVDPKNHNKLMPIGCPGEILIEGPLLARGYLNRQQTEVAFIFNPEWSKGLNSPEGSVEERRMYKSGDMARFALDGSILSAGRKDSQVKINGQRVDLTEIEHHIGASGMIKHVAAFVPKTGPAKARLTLVFSAQQQQASATIDASRASTISVRKGAEVSKLTTELYSILQERVPPYMIPRTWICLDELPVTRNGKLNRQETQTWLERLEVETLDAISTEKDDDSSNHLIPVNAIETLLRSAWSFSLNLPEDKISTSRTLFSLGGDSITAIQICSFLRGQGVQVSVQSILKHRTIAEISKHASFITINGTEPSYQSEIMDYNFPLSPIQRLHIDTVSGGSNHYNQSFFLKLARHFDSEEVRAAMEAIIERHSMLRARFVRDFKGTFTQKIVREVKSSLRFEILADLSSLSETAEAVAQAHKSLDILKGPLVSAQLLCLVTGEQYISLVVHHLAIDLVSWRIVLEDLQQLLAHGRILDKSLPPLSFQVWNQMQIDYAKQEQERALRPMRVIPFEVKPANFRYWGVDSTSSYSTTIKSSFTLDSEMTSAILGNLSEKFHCEPVELLLTAVYYSFKLIFSDRDLPTVFSEGHGRETWNDAIDISRTVGWFTTIFPIAVPQPDQRSSFQTILRRVQDARRLLPKKGWSYFASRYLTDAGAEAFSTHNNMEILFNYLGEFQQMDRADALFERIDPPFEISDVDPSHPRAALFDITAVVEHGKMKFEFSYSSELSRQILIKKWISTCEESLTSLTSMAEDVNTSKTGGSFYNYQLLHGLIDYNELELLLKSVLTQLEGRIQDINDIEDLLPCSPMQQGIMVSRARQDGLYDSQEIWRVKSSTLAGSVDIKRLNKAIQTVIEHHQMLRTSIIQGLGNVPYVQVVLRKERAAITHLKLHDVEALINYPSANIKDGSTLPFTYQFILCEIEAVGEVYCRLEINHALVDGISVRNIARDVIDAYDGSLSHDTPPLYSGFVKYLQERTKEEALTHWTELLRNMEPCLFPTLVEYPVVNRSFNSLHLKIGGKRTEAVHAFCRRMGTTTANFMSAVWAVVLRSYMGTDDVCFGYLSSGRDAPIPDAASIVGPLITMLIRRVRFSSEDSVSKMIQDMHLEFSSGLEHQHSSLAEIYHALGPGKQSSGALFNTVVNVQKGALAAQGQTSSLQFEVTHVYDPSEYDITFNVDDAEENIFFSIQYWTSCLPEEHACLMRDTLLQVVDSLIGNAGNPVRSLDICGETHREWMLKINANQPPAIDMCVHEMVQRQVEVQPEALAISTTALTLTYVQLDTLASKLAGHLAHLGVGPESMVPFCFDKSAWAIIVMYAILKAGGACIGLSPDYPPLRMQSIIESTNSTVIICSTSHALKFEGNVNTTMVIIDDSENNFSALLDQFHGLPGSKPRMASPLNSAFITFTSGSTGTPKGIVIEHGSMCTNLRYNGLMENMTPTSRSLQFGAYTFDVSLDEIFTTLVFGGCVCVPTESERMNDITGFIQAQKIEWAHLTPTVAGLLDPEQILSLRTLVLGGELIPHSISVKWADKVQLIASYGPAECSVTCSGVVIEPSNPRGGLMGHSTAARMWIVDSKDYNRLVPVGCVGEIMIEGPLLARGYLKADQTAAAFITNPSWSLSVVPKEVSGNRRFYKTGDMARYQLDGSLTSAGRKDSQVKVHGQRADLGEIEHHVSTQNPRHGAAFVPKMGYWKDKLIFVFSTWDLPKNKPRTLEIMTSESVAPYITQFCTALEKNVSAYMVPRAWIAVEALPLTQNGKLDRRQVLAWLEEMDPEVCQTVLAVGRGPQVSSKDLTTTEKNILKVWSAVLDIPEEMIGIDQPFFTLGGDSISAMQVTSRLRSQGINLTVHNIMRHKTISAIASLAVYNGASDGDSSTNLKLDKEEIGVPFPLTPIQRMFFNTHPVEFNHYNQSHLIKLHRKFRVEDIQVALRTLIERHSSLRAVYSRDTCGDWTQRIQEADSLTWRFTHSEVVSFEKAKELFSSSQQSLNIQSGQLFSADYVDIAGETLLYLVAHHLAVDVVSWKTLFGDLEDLLSRRPLLNRPISFQAWSKRQNKHFSEIDVEPSKLLPFRLTEQDNLLEYWGMENSLNTYATAAVSDFYLDKLTTSTILGAANQALLTEPVEIIIACILASFTSVFTNRQAPILFSESHGRQAWDDSINVSETVGWFTTMFPIQLQKSSSNLIQALREVKDIRRSLPQQGSAYFASRYLSKTARTAFKGHEAMEILFNFLGIHNIASGQELALEHISLPDVLDVSLETNRSALFDISAAVEQGKLHFRFIHPTLIRRQLQITTWVKACQESIELLATTLLNTPAMPTMADYHLLKPDGYEALDNIIRQCTARVEAEDIRMIESIHPCSAMQEGILLSQSRQSGLYNVQVLLKVISTPERGPVDVERLKKACEAVIVRHQMLRTHFVEMDQAFLQIVLKTLPFSPIYSVKVADLDSLAELGASFRELPSSLPPYAFTLCEVNNGDLYFKMDINHALTDGTSTRIIARDIIKAYDGVLAPVAPTYSDFITHIQSLDENAALNYWKTYLSGIDVCHFPKLIEGSPTPEKNQHRGVDVSISSELGEAMYHFCKEYDTTLATLISACWAIVLRAYLTPDASDSVCFGYLAAGRDIPLPGVYDLVGPMVAMMIRRAEIRRDLTVKELIDTMQDGFVDSLPYQHTSLGRIQHALGLGSERLFNTIVNLQKGVNGEDSRRSDEEKFSSAGFQFEECQSQDPNEYDVCLNVMDTGTVHLSLHYWHHYVSDAHASNLAETLATVIKSVVGNPTQLLANIDLAGNRAVAEVHEFNDDLVGPVDDCIHYAIERMVQEQPDAPAICATGPAVEITFGEMNDLANGLAALLIEQGVTLDTMVPFCFDKSPWAVITMVAILKAGGACVALDPAYPITRLQGITEDVDAKVVIVSTNHASLFETFDLNVIQVDENILKRSISRGVNFQVDRPHQSKPDNAAIVIFTSGSTGKPKGVVLEHRAFCGTQASAGPGMHIRKGSRTLQFAAYTFDLSTEEVFTPLMVGGCVCVPSPYDRLNRLSESINEMRCDYLSLTPTVAGLLDPHQVPLVKTLALGGELPPQSVYERWADRVTLTNGYGPSECTIWTICNIGVGVDTNSSNIGSTKVNCSVWVVDPMNPQRLLPIGVPGEALISGPTLARGYLNDKTKTEASFIQPPQWFQGQAENRFYRSGDIVRFNPDGTVSFIGRKDTQVKVHGQRVELEEIRHHLADIPSIRHAVIRFPQKGPFSKRLIAVVSLRQIGDKEHQFADFRLVAETHRSAASQKITDIRATLEEYLPKHMIPAGWVVVEQVPLLASGKLDKIAVGNWLESMNDETYSAVMSLTPQETSTIVSPSNEIESRLQNIWAELLKRDASTIGTNQSFLRFGGDSILAMHLTSRARAQDINIFVQDVMKLGTIKKLAKQAIEAGHIERQIMQLAIPFSLLPLSRSSLAGFLDKCASSLDLGDRNCIEEAFPCAPIQEGIIISQAKNPDQYWVRAMYRLQTTGEQDHSHGIDILRLVHAFKIVVQRHQALRSYLVDAGLPDANFVQVVARDPRAPISCMECDDLEQFKIVLVSKGYRQRKGLPYQIIICKIRLTGEVYCMVDISHSLDDGASRQILLRDTSIAYNQGELTSNPIPKYSDYVEYIRRQPAEAASAFWKRHLLDVVPCHFPVLQVKAASTGSEEVPCIHRSVDSRKAAAIQRLCVEHEITVADIFKTVWALVLRAYVGNESVCFGFLTSGRDTPIPNVHDILGPFINILACRFRLDDWATLIGLAKETHQDYIQSMAYQYIPLKEVSHLALGPGSESLFNTVVNVLKEVQQPISSQPGISFESMPIYDPTEYAISLDVVEQAGELRFIIDYHTSFISARQAASLASTVTKALDCFIENANQTVAQASLFGDVDRQTMSNWINPDLQPTEALCLHHAFEKQVALQPHAEAVVCDEITLSYLELDMLSNGLANWLIEEGANPDTVIPFCFEKGAWGVVSILAILKSGAACVALDPSHPAERMESIIKDTDATLALTSPVHAKRLMDLGLRVLPVDARTISPLATKRRPSSLASPENVAWVVTTSGSTGTPKCAALEHQSLFVMSQSLSHLGMKSSSRVGHFAAYAYDVSIEETVLALTTGACVCVLSETDRFNDLAGALAKMRISWVELTPTVLRMLDPAAVPSLETVILGGELLPNDVIEKWSNIVDLINSYGPCECSITSSFTQPLTPGCQGSNIGRPWASNFWVVDPKNPEKLQPVGAAGELIIQGPLVGRGYLNNPAKSKAAFIKPPSWAGLPSNSVSGKFYRTGDLVRWNEDGTVIYVGRMDTQVKIRGQRVELGEVEHHICADTLTKGAVAVVPSQGRLKQRLIAVITLQSQKQQRSQLPSQPTIAVINDPRQRSRAYEEIDRIQQSVTSSLPRHMIPSLWIPVETLPLLPSGKTNRGLIEHWLDRLDQDSYFQLIETSQQDKIHLQQPSTAVELTLQRVWETVLDLPAAKIGVNQSFFALGGDSVLAMQSIIKARAEGIAVNVKQIFQQKTIAAIALLCKLDEEEKEKDVAPIEKSSLSASKEALLGTLSLSNNQLEQLEDIYPCSPMQESIISCQGLMQGAWYASFFFELESSSSIPIDIERIGAAWQKLVDRHRILRTSFIKSSDPQNLEKRYQYVAQRYMAPVSYILAHSTDVSDIFDLRPPMPQNDLPPHRLVIAQNQDTGRVFAQFQLSHTLYDAVSVSILWHDLQCLYSGNEPNSAAPLYRTFVEYVETRGRKDSINFWGEYLRGAKPCLLPTLLSQSKQPSPGPPSFDSYVLPFDSELGTKARSFCKQHGVTIGNLFQTSWALVLQRLLGNNRDEVTFGYMLSGRDAPVAEADTILGPFINLMPCRVKLAGEIKLSHLLSSVQGDLVDILMHQSCSLSDISTTLNLDAPTPLFTTFLNMQRVVTHKAFVESDLIMREIGGTMPDEYAISVYVVERDNNIQVSMNYWTNYFDMKEIKGVGSALAHVMEVLFKTGPDVALGDIRPNLMAI